jgi:CHAT domain-containing protein
MSRRNAFAVGIIAMVAAAALLMREWRRDPWDTLLLTAARTPNIADRGRLSAFAPSPRLPVMRGTATGAAPAESTLKAAAFAVLASEHDDHRKAVAMFLVGQIAEAEERLALLTRGHASAAIWNDYAVVLAAKTSASDETLISALAAADRAIDLDPAQTAPRFNRALILDRIGLEWLAGRAFDDYLRVDGTSEWAAEARQRIRENGPQSVKVFRWRELADSGDPQLMRAATSAFPQDARMAVEREILPAWGEAFTRGDVQAGQSHLALARAIGETLRQTSGESMAVDAVHAIDQAANDAERTAALAAGHFVLGEAIALNQARQITAAAPKFEEAQRLLERGSSPLAFVAKHYLVSAAVDRGDRVAALAAQHTLIAATPERYHSLHALMQRLRGTIMVMDGLLGEALHSFEVANAGYRRIGETQSAADTSSRIAGVLSLLGRQNEAWPIFIDAFRTAGAAGSPRSLQMVLHSAAFVALEERRWDVAHALLNLEVDLGPAVPTLHAEALIWRVLAAQRASMERTAILHVGQARTVATSIADAKLRNAIKNELQLVEAMLLDRTAPAQTELLLGEYLAVAEKRDLTRIPQVLVMRAAIRRRLGREDEAERDLRAAIDYIERRRETVQRDVFRDTFLGKSTEAWTALSDLLDARGDYRSAIETADQPRARIIVDRAGTSQAYPGGFIDEVSSHLKPTQALVAWTIYSDRIAIAVIRSNGFDRFVSPVSGATLQASVTRYEQAIRNGDDHAAVGEARHLYGLLIAPARDALQDTTALVLICDSPLDQVPFPALVQPNGRFLIEDFALTIAPGIRAYTTAREHAHRVPTLLSVGNPFIDHARYSTLPSLEAAAREAADVAEMYPDANVLLEREATKERVIALMQQSTIVHLATHALTDASDPQQSRILLATQPTGDDALTASEVAAMNLHHVDMVVLAGCRTAATGQAWGYLQSVSASFLAAGARHVVGSLWDIEDSSGRELSVELHRALRRGLEPAEAVREAQLALIHSSQPAYRAIRSWSLMRLVSVR